MVATTRCLLWLQQELQRDGAEEILRLLLHKLDEVVVSLIHVTWLVVFVGRYLVTRRVVLGDGLGTARLGRRRHCYTEILRLLLHELDEVVVSLIRVTWLVVFVGWYLVTRRVVLLHWER